MNLIDSGLTENRWPGARSVIEGIVEHTTQGNGYGSLSWLLNPASQVGCDFVVMEDGTVHRISNWRDASWHCGVVCEPSSPLGYGANPNTRLVGIEWAGYAHMPLTGAQLAVVQPLHEFIYEGAGRVVPTVMHGEIDSCNRSDPGVLNYAAILMALQGGEMAYADIEDNVKATIRVMLEHDPLVRNSMYEGIRAMLLSAEGAGLVEYAIRYPGGYASKLQAWLDANVMRRLRIGRPTVTRAETFGPIPAPARRLTAPPERDQRGPRHTWPKEYQ